MTLLDKTLSYIGLRAKASIIETDWEARFKKAAADLEKQAGEIGQLRDMMTAKNRLVIELGAKCEALRHDALKWRDRADRERKRGQAKRKGSGK